MKIMRIRRGRWLVVVSLGLYRPGFTHRIWWEGTAESWDLGLILLWCYVSRQVECPT